MSSTATRIRPIYRLALLPLLVGVSLAITVPAGASSHREAPFIATQPKWTRTDFYMFRSYEPGREGYVTLIANYMPLQDPYGGPNYFTLDPNALYEIHVDNNGDAVENITFQFRFQNTLDDNQFTVGGKKVSIPLAQNGSGDVSHAELGGAQRPRNVHARRRLRRPDVGDSCGRDATSPRAARRSTSRSTTSATRRSRTTSPTPTSTSGTIAVPGCSGTGRVFVGPAQGPVRVNLGETFDLVNIKYPATELLAGAEFATVDSLARRQRDRAGPRNADRLPDPGQGRHHRRAGRPPACPGIARCSNHRAAASIPTSQVGNFVQVSRLGTPLVNEVVIGLKDKNKFNGSQPKDDGQFADYVTNPTLPALLEVLFGGAGVKAPTNFPRTDLVAAFLTGVPGLNQPPNVVASEQCAAQHVDSADAGGHPEPPRRHRRRQRRLPERPPPGRRRRRHRAARRDGRAVHAQHRRLQAGRCAGRLAALHRWRVHQLRVLRQRAFPYLRAPLKGSPNDDNAIKQRMTQ